MATFKTPDGKEINLSTQLQERIVEDGEKWLSDLKEALDTGKLPPDAERNEKQLERDAEEAFREITAKMTPEQKQAFLSTLKKMEASALLQKGNVIDMPGVHRMLEKEGFTPQEIEKLKHTLNTFLNPPAVSDQDTELFSQIYNARLEQQLGLVHFGSHLSEQAKEQIEKQAWNKASIMGDMKRMQNETPAQMEKTIEHQAELVWGNHP